MRARVLLESALRSSHSLFITSNHKRIWATQALTQISLHTFHRFYALSSDPTVVLYFPMSNASYVVHWKRNCRVEKHNQRSQNSASSLNASDKPQRRPTQDEIVESESLFFFSRATDTLNIRVRWKCITNYIYKISF